MGKSLSTLALITKTLDKAYDWALELKANVDDQSRQKACRATLILVPSASKSPCNSKFYISTINIPFLLVLIDEWFREIDL